MTTLASLRLLGMRVCLRSRPIALVKSIRPLTIFTQSKLNASLSLRNPQSLQFRDFFGGNKQQDELDELYMHADSKPQDVVAQAELLEFLAVEEPDECIRRYESGQFASDDRCTKAYIEALVETGRLAKADLSTLLPSVTSAVSAQAKSSPTASSISNLTRPINYAPPMQPHGISDLSYYGKDGKKEPIPVTVHQDTSFFTDLRKFIFRILSFVILIAVVSVLFDDRMGAGGKSGAQQQYKPEVGKETKFEDVQGADEAKSELQDVVEFLRSPEKFTRLGGKLPKGVLLVGPPGTGKTMLARAVAGEAGVNFFYTSGSEFEEMYVGLGARRVRDLFAAARKNAPSIVFIDEIDAVGGKRHFERSQVLQMTLNQLLVEMDGFDQKETVIVIAATNFPEALDGALTRPGRFDTHVRVPLPDVRGRLAILQAHSKTLPLADRKDLMIIARGTVGMSGAELANLVNQAALQASRLNLDKIDLPILEWAKDKILMGAERKSAVINQKDKEMTAYHEAGHALCALYSDGATPIYKATIVPRGLALGMVTQLPEDDVNSLTRKQLLARLVVCMGGRAAEEIIYGKNEVSTGASSDVQQATDLARAMVTRYAMSDKIGPILVDENKQKFSPEFLSEVEGEIRALLDDAYAKASKLLKDKEKEHHRLAKALLDYETLTAEEIKLVVAGKPLGSRKT